MARSFTVDDENYELFSLPTMREYSLSTARSSAPLPSMDSLQEVVTLSSRFPFLALMALLCLLGTYAVAQTTGPQAIGTFTLNTGDAKAFITWLTEQQPTLADEIMCTAVDTHKVIVKAETQDILHSVFDQVLLFEKQSTTNVATAHTGDADTQSKPGAMPNDDTKTYEMILPLRYMDANVFEKLFSPKAKIASDAHWEPNALTQEAVDPQTLANDHVPLNTVKSAPDTQGALTEFIPDGAEYQILDFSHVLLTANSPEMLVAFRDFIRMIDTKTKKVTLTINAVKLLTDQQSMVDITATDKSLVTPVHYVTKPQTMIDAMIKQKQIELLATGKADIANGGKGFVELLIANLPGVAIQELLIHPDNSVTVCLQPLIESASEKTADGMIINTVDPQRSASQLRARVKDNEAVMLGVHENVFLLITPHVVDETPADTDQ